MNPSSPLWTPSPAYRNNSYMQQFLEQIKQRHHLALDTYQALYDWSIREKERFWAELWNFCGVTGEMGAAILVDGEDMERATWFPEGRLNFAANLLRGEGTGTAILFQAEDRVRRSLSHDELRDQVVAVREWLLAAGIRPGDRVAGYLPNMIEGVVAMLATASLGGIWTSTSPDFGVESVVDRFGQTTPRVLFTADGYFYNGKIIKLTDRIQQLQRALPSLEHTVVAPLLGSESAPGIPWQEILARPVTEESPWPLLPFNHPLYILYSSGTTGKPKCIVHKAGGVLLQHLKEHQLHCDIKPQQRVFYYTTCGWMMWNWLASALASRATLVLYDGSPFYPDGSALWQLAEEAEVSLFGTSAKYLDHCRNLGLRPREVSELSQLKIICSTGSVLAPESFDYVYDAIKTDVCLASISGGTDLISCFVLGCPTLPVYRGESQCRGLAMAVEVFAEDGRSLVGEKGELVCTATFPSQPLSFWNDPRGEKYHNAYFARYPGVWHHGDYVLLHPEGGVTILGRSDATLNPGGVRIGTAEIYRHVERLEEIAECLAVGQQWHGDERVVLFVVPNDGWQLDQRLQETIRSQIRSQCSPRHVPAVIIQVPALPRTKSGKIVELAVKELIHGRELHNLGSIANPEVLSHFRDLVQLRPADARKAD